MYYNTKNNQILTDCPLNGYFADGTLVQGLDATDLEIKKACGILPVKSDSPIQPLDSYEDVSQRTIIIENDGVIITRVYLPNRPESPTPPETISARQIRLWLIDNNISLTSVESAIDSIVDEKLREKTKVEWEYAPYVERNHPLIENICSILGLNKEQIDNAFFQASQL